MSERNGYPCSHGQDKHCNHKDRITRSKSKYYRFIGLSVLTRDLSYKTSKLNTPKLLVMPDDAAARARTERRNYIIDWFSKGESPALSWADVNRAVKNPDGKAWTQPTAYNDANYLRKLGIGIVFVGGRFKRDAKYLTDYQERAQKFTQEKKAIGEIARVIIMPTADQKKWILNEIDTSFRRLRSKLIALWEQRMRMVALDAGSTTQWIAQALSSGVQPDEHDDPALEIQILTNSETVQETIRELWPSGHRLITVGGTEQFDMRGTAGYLADQCLAAWGLESSVAFVGATRLDGSGRFCCNYESEVSIKRAFLGTARNALRGIVMHSEKIRNPEAAPFPFAAIRDVDVDLIVTDPELRRKSSDPEETIRCQEFQERARDAGVYIAIGEQWYVK